MKNENDHIIAGIHSVELIIGQTGFYATDELRISRKEDARLIKILRKAQNVGAKVVQSSFASLTSLHGSDNHQGILLIRKNSVKLFIEFGKEDIHNTPDGSIFIVADGITDPGNIGAMARSMVAFGAAGLIISKHRSSPVGESSLKSSAGTLINLPVCHISSIANFLLEMKKSGYLVLGAGKKGEFLSARLVEEIKADATKIFIVMGSEDKGLSHLVEERCDKIISIAHSDKAESLNVSNATAIILYQFCSSGYIKPCL